jgi:HNH endonuclease
MINGVKRPFPEFKWRWASFQLSEGLNEPRVFLGVLRALAENEGLKASSPEVMASLREVEADLAPHISGIPNLARRQDRNLLRNSQQYWTGLGLLDSTSSGIKLTAFGRRVADGKITREEFAGTTVLTLSLPNRRIETEAVIKKWDEFDIKINPLMILMSTIISLNNIDSSLAYLTNEEVVRVIIPLSSLQVGIEQYVAHVLHFRDDPDFFNSYDNFAPEANDARMAREFLLFLSYYGYLVLTNPEQSNYTQRFILDSRALKSIEALLALAPNANNVLEDVAEIISVDAELGATERERRMVRITSRPGQQKFRRGILKNAHGKCLITGETLAAVLSACHIIPVELNGSDSLGNGLCLREDLHIMFDAGHLRIDLKGNLHLSDAARQSATYQHLPTMIALPAYINRGCLAHRWKYLT